MSEFKYACPVCGQHIKCDSSQAGSVMECPTCFQKITVPQAPTTGDQKFILTGSKVMEKKFSVHGTDAPAPAAAKKSPVVASVAVLMILAVGAGFFFFGRKPAGETVTRSVSAADWRASDIGAVEAAGSFHLAKGIFTIIGSGADIWHQADGFHYVYQPLNGDGALTAQVLQIHNTHEWAKAGVMIRETTNANAAFVLASIRADGQTQFLWRKATGAEAEASGLAGGPGYPKWVKIVRNGDSFGAYFKVQAEDDWQPMGATQTIHLAPNTQIGLAVCSHNAGTLCEAKFARIEMQSENKARPAAPPAAPKPVAPPASDTNWMLTLGTNAIPDGPVAGRIHGQDFLIERANFQNGTLTLRAGTRGPVEFAAQINFNGASPESLAGKHLNILADTNKSARVTLRWKDAGGAAQKENYDINYAMRLEFGPLVNNRLRGKIYLCLPDEAKSYLLGSFNADARKPKPKPPKP